MTGLPHAPHMVFFCSFCQTWQLQLAGLQFILNFMHCWMLMPNGASLIFVATLGHATGASGAGRRPCIIICHYDAYWWDTICPINQYIGPQNAHSWTLTYLATTVSSDDYVRLHLLFSSFSDHNNDTMLHRANIFKILRRFSTFEWRCEKTRQRYEQWTVKKKKEKKFSFLPKIHCTDTDR